MKDNEYNVNGTVRWWMEKKGFGFLQADNHPDTFVHFSVIILENGEVPFKNLTEGQKVIFDIIESQKGPQANNVRKVK